MAFTTAAIDSRGDSDKKVFPRVNSLSQQMTWQTQGRCVDDNNDDDGDNNDGDGDDDDEGEGRILLQSATIKIIQKLHVQTRRIPLCHLSSLSDPLPMPPLLKMTTNLGKQTLSAMDVIPHP